MIDEQIDGQHNLEELDWDYVYKKLQTGEGYYILVEKINEIIRRLECSESSPPT